VATFKAIRIDKADKDTTAALTQFDEADLMEGDVTVRVEWSTLNYKDGLAVTGKAPVVRRFPMIAGIDFAGTVEQSTDPQWKAGDKVIVKGLMRARSGQKVTVQDEPAPPPPPTKNPAHPK